MTTLWFAILAVALISFAIKAAGPAVLTGRDLPPWTSSVIALLAPALLAALVVVHVLGEHWSAVSVPVLLGLAAVVVAHVLRAPMLVSVLAGVVVTAALRALTGW
jgi:branched-subunit amino acid transport protein